MYTYNQVVVSRTVTGYWDLIKISSMFKFISFRKQVIPFCSEKALKPNLIFQQSLKFSFASILIKLKKE